MTIYFMRHGESTYNVLGLCNDRIDDSVRLTERGQQQAHEAATRLADAAIHRVISSPLPRARQTAEIVNLRLGVPIEMQPAIHDWRTGMDGQPVSELYRAIAHDPWHARVDGGESLADHFVRVGAFLAELERKMDAPTLVVAHEETLRVAAAHFHRLDRASMLALKFINCEIIAFENGGRTRP